MTYDFYIKIICFAILLYLIYYFFYKFDFDSFMKLSLKNINKKEHFSLIFNPNKLYRYNNKIYLLDTNNILIKDKNPLVFNNFQEYKDYVNQLEEEAKENFNDIETLDDIENEENINSYDKFDKEQIKKYKSPDSGNFHLINKCAKKVAFCDDDELKFNTITIKKPFEDDIFKPKKSKECRKDICNINYLPEETCKKIETLNKKEDILKLLCSNKVIDNPIVKKECKSFNKYTRLGNRRLYDQFCLKETKLDMEKCLLGEYFKENMMEFEL